MSKGTDAGKPAIADAPIKAAPAFTPGPLSVAWDKTWPFDLVTYDAGNNEVWRESAHCTSSKARTLEDHLNAVGFRGEVIKSCRAALQRQYADALLRAAAPEMFEALRSARIQLVSLGGGVVEGNDKIISDAVQAAVLSVIDAALLKATGGQS